MNWLVFALAGPAFMGINNLIDKYVLDKHVREVGAFTIIYGFTSLIISIVLFIVIGFKLLDIRSTILILFAGVIQMGIFLSYFKALTLDEASRVTPLFQFIPVFTLLLAAFFLGEILKPIHLFGFGLIFISGFALSGKTLNINVFVPRPAFWYMFFASLGSASLGVIFKFVVGLNSFWQTIAWENLGIGIASFILLLVPLYRQQFLNTVKALNKRIYGLVLINELAFFLARLSLRYAFTLAPVALVTVLMGVQPLFVLFYTVILTLFAPTILKEDIRKKIILQKLALMVVILVGVYFISK